MSVEFIGAGSVASANGSTVSPSWPTHRPDDIGILLVDVRAATPGSVTGWTEIASLAASYSQNLKAYWKRATSSSESAPTGVGNASGTYQGAAILAFRGVDVANPIDASATLDDSAGGTSQTLADVTTTVANAMILNFYATGNGTTGNMTTSGWTNGNLASITEVLDWNWGAVGSTVSLHGACGIKVAAGAVGNTTVTTSANAGGGTMTIALKPGPQETQFFNLF